MKTQPRITLLDYCILGVLAQNSMSGYGIRMIFEKTALASYSSSPGSIYPALKRLQKLILIEKKVKSSGQQELYAITKKGSAALYSWIIQHVTRNDVIKNFEILMLRFAFMDVLAKKTEKKKFLESFHEAVKKYTHELETYQAAEFSKMPLSGQQAFEHGLESHRATLRWIEKILSKI